MIPVLPAGPRKPVTVSESCPIYEDRIAVPLFYDVSV
jgi:hypothetical protein